MIREEKQRWLKDGGEELQYIFDGIGPGSIVFDIGLYRGKWSKGMSERYDPFIYGFEPVPEFFGDAQKSLEFNPKVKLFNIGLGGDTRESFIFVDGDATSLVTKCGREETVKIVSIKEFMSGHGIQYVDLASINIEGGEYELLDFMFSEGLMPNFGALLIQFHENGRYESEDIRKNLMMTHEIIYSYDTVWDYWKKRK